MADIAKAGTPSMSTLGPQPGANKLPTLIAAEDIAAGDACYIASGGVTRSTGAAATAPARVHGYAPYAVKSGESITLVYNVTFRYASGLTAGASVWLSGATAGALADAASTGGTLPIGVVLDATRIYLWQSRYGNF